MGMQSITQCAVTAEKSLLSAKLQMLFHLEAGHATVFALRQTREQAELCDCQHLGWWLDHFVSDL